MHVLSTPFFNSIRFKMSFGLIIVTLPIILLLIYNNLYSMQLVREQVAQSNSNLLDLYMGLIDKELESIDTYLFQIATQEPRLNDMDRPAEQDLDRYNLAKYQLFREFYDNSSPYNTLDFFFIYSIVNEDLILAPKILANEKVDTVQIKGKLNGIFKDQNKMQNYEYEWWTHLSINETPFLIHIIKSGNVYIGALVNYKQLMKPLDQLDLGPNGKSLLVGADNEPMQEAAFFKDNQINLNYETDTFQLTGTDQKFLVIGEKSDKGDFSLLAVLPDRNILEKLPYTQRIIIVIACGTIFILMAALFMLRRTVLLPINRIIVAMKKIKDGHLEARILDTSTSPEFQLMNESFNRMVEQIQKLKIDIYEEQLFSQKAELKHLQLQINPHFYLNSLNTFYYLADDNNNAVIKELSLSLIKYFRFMFRSHSDFVLLEEEMKHVQNYLLIQKFRFPEGLTYQCSVPDSLLAYNVPPLIIQTFVENAIKHAVSLDEPIQIQIIISHDRSDPNERMNIRVQDSGKGFSSEVLQQLQENINPNNDSGDHIGIWNIKRRLWLLYRGQADIVFHNEGGAVIDMSLPLR